MLIAQNFTQLFKLQKLQSFSETVIFLYQKIQEFRVYLSDYFDEVQNLKSETGGLASAKMTLV